MVRTGRYNDDVPALEAEVAVLRDLLREVAAHLDGSLGASQRLNSDSGELYTRINDALARKN